MTLPVTLADIRAAACVIEGKVIRTPLALSRTLSDITGAELWIKFENQQFTASFKERGAAVALAALDAAQRRAGVITMSAGNHAQGLAYHARRAGIAATIVMPRGTPHVKLRQTRDHGATVVLDGDTLNEAFAAAQTLAAQRGLTLVHPFDNADVIAGQGTVGLEILEERPDLDVIVVPVGGGGLISGIAVAAKTLNPGIAVIGAESALYPCLRNHLTGERQAAGGMTIAEGIAVNQVGALTGPLVRALVDDILLVSEAEIEQAVALYLAVEKTVAEGAGAAPLAAILGQRARFAGKRVAVVLSGGNIDLRLLGGVIMRNLVREGRVSSLRVTVNDSPGALARIAGLIGQAGGNILEVSHQRMFLDVAVRNADVDLVLETRDADHLADIVQCLAGAGYEVRRLRTTGLAD